MKSNKIDIKFDIQNLIIIKKQKKNINSNNFSNYFEN